MPCLCTFYTLRSFIRGVAQLDISTNSRLIVTSNKPRKQLLQPRGVCQPFRLQYTTSASQRSQQDKVAISHDVDLKGVFAEITPETIDALAAEVQFEYTQQPATSSQERKSPDPTTNWSPSSTNSKIRNVERARKHYAGAKGDARQFSPTTARRNSLQLEIEAGNESSGNIDTDALPRYRSYPDEVQKGQQGRQDILEPGSITGRQPWQATAREPWQAQKSALQEKFQDGWNPMKRLSPDALAGIRALHAQMPDVYTTAMLAENFKVSPEAIRRILKSKWTPKQDEEIDRQRRWFKRGEKVWTKWNEDTGMKPPARWRAQGVGEGYHRKKKAAMREREQAGRGLYLGSSKRDKSRPIDDIPWGS